MTHHHLQAYTKPTICLIAFASGCGCATVQSLHISNISHATCDSPAACSRMTESCNRRRLPAYTALAASADGRRNSSDGHEAGGGVFNSLYTALGGWLIEPPMQMMASAVPDPAQSISQVFENMGNWALRGVMLNMCLPVSVRPTPATSRSHSPTELLAAGVQPPGGSNSSNRNATVAAADACDAMRSPRRQDTGKQPLGLGVKPLGSSSSNVVDTHRAVADAATNTSSDRTDTAAAQQEENERLRREVSCLRTTLGTMYLSYAHLQEENQRLRSGDGGEELLSDALQQLLSDKSALQQEVSRLSMQNKALQELLDYAAAPAASSEPPWNSTGSYCWQNAAADAGYTLQAYCGGSSHLYDMQQAAAAPGAGSQQQQQQCVYWLATPAGSVTHSSPASGRNSPEASTASSTGPMRHSATQAAAAAASAAVVQRSLEAAAAQCEQAVTAAAQAQTYDSPMLVQPETAGVAIAAALAELEEGVQDSSGSVL